MCVDNELVSKIELKRRELANIANYIIIRRGEDELEKLLNENICDHIFIERTIKHMLWSLLQCEDDISCRQLISCTDLVTNFFCNCLMITAEEVVTGRYYEHDL